MRVLKITLIVAGVVALAGPASGMKIELGADVYGVGNSLIGDLPNEGSWKGRSGLGIGLVAGFDVADDVAVRFQPTFIQRNSRQEFESWGEVIAQNDYDFDYLSLPLVVRVTADPVGVRGFVTSGMALDILIDATEISESGSEDISDQLESTTLSALFGVGVMVPLGLNFLTFELRYVQGLGSIVTGNSGEPEGGLGSSSVKYRGLSLIVGCLFTLGGE